MIEGNLFGWSDATWQLLDQFGILLGDVLEWLMKVELLSPGRGFRDAMEQLKAMSAREYQRATEEALAILKWIRYFADAMKGGGNA